MSGPKSLFFSTEASKIRNGSLRGFGSLLPEEELLNPHANRILEGIKTIDALLASNDKKLEEMVREIDTQILNLAGVSDPTELDRQVKALSKNLTELKDMVKQKTQSFSSEAIEPEPTDEPNVISPGYKTSLRNAVLARNSIEVAANIEDLTTQIMRRAQRQEIKIKRPSSPKA